MDLDIRPLTPDQHDAVLRYFDLVAYADHPAWSNCYCMERLAADFPTRTKEQNRATRSELLAAAIDHLRERGMRAVEAYPRSGEPEAMPYSLYVGPMAMYARAGFNAYREFPDFTVVRRSL